MESIWEEEDDDIIIRDIVSRNMSKVEENPVLIMFNEGLRLIDKKGE